MNIVLAAITLPLWVAVSQWVLLLVLGFFVVVAYRQLGYMLRLEDIGSEQDGLAIGETAPAFDYIAVNHNGRAGAHFDPPGQWSLLLFADPGCTSCRIAVSAVEHLAPTLRGTRVLVATTAGPQVIVAVEEFRDASVPIGRIAGEGSIKAYRTLTTPFAFLIDPEGIVKAKGIMGDESTLRRLMAKADHRNLAHIVPTRL